MSAESKATIVSPFFFIHVMTIVVVSLLLLITLFFLLNCLMTWCCDYEAKKFNEVDETDGRKKLLEVTANYEAAYYQTIHRLLAEANAVEASGRLQGSDAEMKVTSTDFSPAESANTPSLSLFSAVEEETRKTNDKKERKAPKNLDKTLLKPTFPSPSSNLPEKLEEKNVLGKSSRNVSTTRRIRFNPPQPKNNNRHRREQPKPMTSLENAEAKLAQLRDELANFNVDHCIQLKTTNLQPSTIELSRNDNINNGNFTIQRRQAQQSSQEKQLAYKALNRRQHGAYGNSSRRALHTASTPLYISYKAKGGGRETIV